MYNNLNTFDLQNIPKTDYAPKMVGSDFNLRRDYQLFFSILHRQSPLAES